MVNLEKMPRIIKGINQISAVFCNGEAKALGTWQTHRIFSRPAIRRFSVIDRQGGPRENGADSVSMNPNYQKLNCSITG